MTSGSGSSHDLKLSQRNMLSSAPWPRRRHGIAALAVALVFVLALSLAGCTGAEGTADTQPGSDAARTASETREPNAAEPTVQPDAAPAPAGTVSVTAASVTRVVDGDTVEVQLADGTREKVRFIGVDTPESTNEVEVFGPEASAFTAQTLTGRTVYLETDAELRDRYGRLLAHVWLEVPEQVTDETVRAYLFNAHLLLAGYANLMTIPPNVKYVDYLRTCESEARLANAGLWAPPPAAAAPAPAATPAPSAPSQTSGAYIANRNTGKFHHSYCGSVSQMNPANKVPYATRDQAASAGYVPCKNCNP